MQRHGLWGSNGGVTCGRGVAYGEAGCEGVACGGGVAYEGVWLMEEAWFKGLGFGGFTESV